MSLGNGPNTVSGSTVSNTELSEFFDPHRVPGRELSEFLSAFYFCAKANSPSFSENSPSLPRNSVRLSEFSSPKQYSRNSIPLPFPSPRDTRAVRGVFQKCYVVFLMCLFLLPILKEAHTKSSGTTAGARRAPQIPSQSL